MRFEIPLPLPDELIYSTISRGLLRSGYPRRLFSELVLGRRNTLCPHAPAGLNALAKLLYGGAMTGEHLLDNHTVARAWLPFALSSESVRERLLSAGDAGKCPNAKRAFEFRFSVGLRCCAQCMEDDRRDHGEAYWHREHQTPEARVCLKHGSVLMESRGSRSLPKDSYLTLGATTDLAEVRIEAPPEVHMRVSAHINSLLRTPKLSFNRETFSRAALALIRPLTASNNVMALNGALMDLLIRRFGSAYFRDLSMGVTGYASALDGCFEIQPVFDANRLPAAPHIYAMLADCCGGSLVEMLGHQAGLTLGR